jgi:hypothetical protein
MFLNPIMLAGLFAIAVPVAIHLLNRRKTQRVVWAAMRFLQASVRRNQRRMRVQDWLLLLMRCGLMALLALIVARPALHAAASYGRTGVTAVIVLDNSYSMSQSDGAVTNFDRARKSAEQVLDSLGAGGSAAVLLASDTVEELIPQPTTDLDLARQTIREAKLTDRSTDLLPAMQRAAEILSGKAGGQIHLITDDRLNGWRQFEAIRQLIERSKDRIRTSVVLVHSLAQANLAVTDLRLSSPMAIAGRPTMFEARVTNFAAAEARGIEVRLSADGKTAADQVIIDSIAPRQSRSVTLSARLDAGDHTVTVSIPADHLPADDARTIAVRAVSRINVLLVDGGNSGAAQGSEVLFLRQALVPVPAGEAEGYYLQTKTVSPAQLASVRLGDFDAVFLVDVPEFVAPISETLGDYVRRGGSLVLFPGPQTQVDSYNGALGAVTAAKLGPSQSGTFTLSAENLDPSLLQIWKDASASVLGAAHVTRRFPVHVADDSRVLMRYSDHSPALIERSVGQGRVALFNSTANTAWNDLPLHAELFVPLVQQLLASTLSHQDEDLNIRVGQHFIWHPASELIGREATIVPPKGAQSTPQTRSIALVGARPTLDFAETSSAGAYDVIVSDPPAHVKFATQADPEESDPQPLTAQQKEELSKVAQVTDASNVSGGGVFDDRAGRELWLPLALLAIALACVETVASERFSRPK